MPQQPIRIFIAYSRQDIAYLNKLKDVLKPLVNKGSAQVWYDGEIMAGSVWEESIKKALHEAQIILLLLSPDSLASDYFYEKEVADALERHHQGQCKVVPVIIRDCLWEETNLTQLQALPQDAKPIADWQNPDSAYKSIGTGISKLIADIQEQHQKTEADKQHEANERRKKENNKKQFWQQLQAADDLFKQQNYLQASVAYAALQNWGDKADLGYTNAQPHIIQRLMLCEQEVQYSDLKKQAFDLHQQAKYKAALQATQQALQYRADPDLSDLKKQLNDLITKQTQKRTALLQKIGMGVGGVLLVFALVWGMNQWAGNTHSIKPEQVDTPFVAPRTDTAHRDTTSPPIAEADAYTMLLNEGNELFVKAEYVAAKAKYAAALKQRPKDPTATANIKKCDDKLKPPPIAPQEQATVQPKPKPVADPFASQMILIRGGTFMMGSPASEADREDNEQQHRVTLSDYYIGAYEVTQAQWRLVMGKNPSEFKGDKFPVEDVSWDDIQNFLDKLNAQTGKKYRLPTEAQWEYAARGGTTTPFYTGKCLSTDQANYEGNYPYQSCSKGKYREKTTPVGSFAANAYGLYDMHGNVWEWCHDWYGANYYKNSPTNNPTGPKTGTDRVLRGGSWHNYAQYCRVAFRGHNTPGFRYNYAGFRLAVGP